MQSKYANVACGFGLCQMQGGKGPFDSLVLYLETDKWAHIFSLHKVMVLVGMYRAGEWGQG